MLDRLKIKNKILNHVIQRENTIMRIVLNDYNGYYNS